MRKIALILVLSMLLTVISACGGGNEVSDDTNSGAEVSSEVSGEVPQQTMEEYIQSVENAYQTLGVVSYKGGKAPDTALEYELVSKGAKYTSSIPSRNNSDKRNFLTDGVIAERFSGSSFANYEGGEAVSFVIDLGESRDDLSKFTAVCYGYAKQNTFLPVAVTYAVGETDSNFTDVGRVFAVTTDQSLYDFTLTLDSCASGRYVKVTFEATQTKAYYVGELGVYARTATPAAQEKTGIYPEVVLDTQPGTHANPSDKIVNLIANKKVQIGCLTDMLDSEKTNNSTIDNMLLTNGKHATENDIHNGQFFKVYLGGYRDIYFDFGAVSTVEKITAEFTHNVSWGVKATPVLDVKLSDDGENWYHAASVEVYPESEAGIVNVEHTFEKPVNARYICYTVYIDLWMGISELEAFGTTNEKGVSLQDSGYEFISPKGYLQPSEDVLGGASDLMLLYHSQTFDWTEKTLIPYLAYVDKSGEIKDTMFDSFTFLLSGSLPSGRTPNTNSVKSDWEWFLDDLFTQDQNILALEKAAGTVKEALGLGDDYTFAFTVTLYCPQSGITDFGDVDGDGVSEDFSNNADRMKALKWYMDEFESRYASYGFKNIKFDGYYWYSESVTSRGNDLYIVKEAAKEVHARGYDFIWIPYFVSNGFTYADHIGFDAACMQPNYVFDETAPYSRIPQTAYWAQMYGLGIEIEMDWNSLANEDKYNRYMEYLVGGAKYGYMKDCWHMYYQDVNALYTAAISSNDKTRELYDATYQFIKGTLPAYPDALETITVNTKANTVYKGTVMENVSEDFQANLTASPAHGTVALGDDGVFTYYPEKDFKGTVSFKYTFGYGMGDSGESEVIINIE